jgi:colicin import membrane protein
MLAPTHDRDLNPPAPPRAWGAWLLALLVHALLLAALAWGIHWQRETTAVAAAELWASLPQVAAPRAQAPETPPPAPPVREPAPAAPAPAPPAQPKTPTQADIQVQRSEPTRSPRPQAPAPDKPQRERQSPPRDDAREQARQAAHDQAEREKAEREKAAQQRAREQAAREQAQLEAERQRTLERLLGQAQASGAANAQGQAARDAGPSASYAGKLVAHIRPNIVFADTLPGNPRAEVEVRTLPDGSILSSRLLKSSGYPAWDDAVLRAIERTGRLPRDENGRIPSTLILGFRPQD